MGRTYEGEHGGSITMWGPSPRGVVLIQTANEEGGDPAYSFTPEVLDRLQVDIRRILTAAGQHVTEDIGPRLGEEAVCRCERPIRYLQIGTPDLPREAWVHQHGDSGVYCPDQVAKPQGRAIMGR